MSDVRSLQTLQQLVRREARSLMQYLIDAYPWTSASGAEAVDRLRAMILAERDALTALTRYLYRHGMPPPHGGGYPSDFTSLNFVGLEHIVDVLARHQEDAIDRLQTDLDSVDPGEGRQLAEALLALKKKHLETLHEMRTPEPAVAS